MMLLVREKSEQYVLGGTRVGSNWVLMEGGGGEDGWEG